MVERLPVRLSLTQEEADRYSPPKGINVSWIAFEKPDVVVAEFTASEVHPDQAYKRTGQDLRHEVESTFRHRIITNNLTNYPLRSRRIRSVYAMLEHPQVTGRGVDRDVRRAAEAATDVVDVELSQDQWDYMHKQTGLKPNTVQPKEVRQRRKVTRRAMGPEAGAVEETGPLETVYVVQSGLVDAG